MAYVPNSSVAGFLGAITPIPADQAIEDALNPTIAGITNLDGNQHVRPRLSKDPPTIPDRSVNWVAFGISDVSSDTCAATVMSGDTTALVIRNQVIEVLLSWYGPSAGDLAEVFRDGLQIGQNRALLRANSLGFVSISSARKVPELLKQQFVPRYDQTLILNRRTERQFSILSLQGFGIQLDTDPAGSTPIIIST